jgi:DNA-binding Lrp family transcriptional regulator
MRRFGAFVRHQKMGFTFNGMSVWDVPHEDCTHIGRCFASFPFVSHCYERPRNEAWPYNLYAMVHGKTEEELEAHLALMRESSGLDCEVLVSLKEYKKTSPVYFG